MPDFQENQALFSVSENYFINPEMFFPLSTLLSKGEKLKEKSYEKTDAENFYSDNGNRFDSFDAGFAQTGNFQNYKLEIKRRPKKMKKLLLLACASLVFTACGMIGGAKNDNTGTTKTETGGKLKVGDTVVFKLSSTGFGEGKIESVDGSRYKIPYGSSTNTVDEADVYAIPVAGSTSDVKVGDFVVAKRGNENYWYPSEVTRADGKAIEVKTLSSGEQTMNLSPEQVIPVRPATSESFKKLKSETGFETKAGSMRPVIPSDFLPKKGDKVVASWSGNSWYAGTIISSSGDKAKIKWDTNFNDGDVDLRKIAPLPRIGSSAAPFKSGDVLLVKSTSNTSAWEFAEATSDREVRLKDGKTRSVRGDEYVPFN